MKPKKYLSRRGFLKTALVSLSASVLSACAGAVEKITATLAPSATPPPASLIQAQIGKQAPGAGFDGTGNMDAHSRFFSLLFLPIK